LSTTARCVLAYAHHREFFAVEWVPANQPNNSMVAFNAAWTALGPDGQKVRVFGPCPLLFLLITVSSHTRNVLSHSRPRLAASG
jgi:hypothetical protein